MPSTKGNAMAQTRLGPVLLAVIAATLLSTSSGCFQATGPTLGVFSIPIPVSPYWQKNYEDEFHVHERYARAPILGPLTTGGPAVALDPPSDDEVWWALERARPTQGGVPFLHETHRNNIVIVKDKIADYVDPPRVVPLIGPVQLHHAHYKCTVYYSERKIIGWPFPHTLHDEEAQEVLYVDHNHFHMVGDVDFGSGTTNY
jgi:hypothetical protein